MRSAWIWLNTSKLYAGQVKVGTKQRDDSGTDWWMCVREGESGKQWWIRTTANAYALAVCNHDGDHVEYIIDGPMSDAQSVCDELNTGRQKHEQLEVLHVPILRRTRE